MKRTLGRAWLLGVLLLVACQPGPTAPDGGAGTPNDASPPGVAPTSTAPAAAFHPLPPDLQLRPGPQDPSARLEPSSPADAETDVIRPFTLGHCGLGSPFDFDGSFWDPVAGRDAQGGSIDTDDEIVELINPTEGEVLLLASGQAQFRTPTGSIVLLSRHVGARDFFLCG